RMDESGDRGRTFHSVGQPDVEWNLRRLARRANEQQQGNQRGRAEARLGSERGRRPRNLVEIERTEPNEGEDDAENESVVADPVDNERLFARIRCGFLLVPEADEQIRTQPDTLPADE